MKHLCAGTAVELVCALIGFRLLYPPGARPHISVSEWLRRVICRPNLGQLNNEVDALMTEGLVEICSNNPCWKVRSVNRTGDTPWSNQRFLATSILTRLLSFAYFCCCIHPLAPVLKMPLIFVLYPCVRSIRYLSFKIYTCQ